jgi:hypothetical protein
MKSRAITFALLVACALLLGALLAWPAQAVPDIYEPDDWPEDATPLVVGVAQEHTIDPAGDADYVSLEVVEGGVYQLEASVGPESPLDPDLWIEDPVGYYSDKGDIGEPEIYAFVAKASGTYVFRIWSGNASLGDVSAVPTRDQRLIGKLEFSLMRFLAEDEPFAF